MKRTFLFLLLLLLMLSCSCPINFTAFFDKIKPQNTPTAESNDLLSLIAKDRIRVVSTNGNLDVSSFTGRTIQIELYNNSGTDLEVSVTCGLAFIPTDEKASRMMVVQPMEIDFRAGETKMIKPFVLSIDALKSLPTETQTYRIDTLPEGNQLDFAQCLCKSDLPAETETRDLFSLQVAAWMLDSDSPLANLPDTINDWLQNTTGLPITIPGLSDTLQDITGNLAPEAQAWLDKCGITVNK